MAKLLATLVDAPTLKQKFLMEPFFGFSNEASTPIDTQIYPGAGYTAQGVCHVKLSTGVEYLFVAQRPHGSSYTIEEQHRIVQFPYKTDGSVAAHIAYSAVLNIGHSGGISAVVNPDDSITLFSWSETISAHIGNDSGKGFSKIEWKGAATTQADVTSYQVFGYNDSKDPRSAYRHADCSVDHTGSEIAFIAYKTNKNSDDFIDQTVFIFDLQALLTAPSDAARLQVVPKAQWVSSVPFVDRGMYKQGIAIRNGIVAVISGFTNPFVPETISFYDSQGNLIRRAQPTNNRAIYGLDNLLDHPTLGTPMQFEPEGICFIDDCEVIFLMMDQWRQGASIVSYTSPLDPPPPPPPEEAPVPRRFSRISPSGSGAPTEVDLWAETKKGIDAPEWSASGSYGIGGIVSRRSKRIYSLRVPKGDAGELPLSAGMPSQWAKMTPISTYENTPNTIFKADTPYQIYGYSYALDEYFPAAEYVYTRTSASVWRIRDFWTQKGPNLQMTYSWNESVDRQFGGVGFASGTGGIFFYGDQDSKTPGQVIIRSFGGGGLRIRDGEAGALVPWTDATDLGAADKRWGTAHVGAVAATGQVSGATLRTTPVAVASLPAAATAGAGARAFVTDASAATFNSVVAGGGTNKVPVFSDGASWRIG